MEIGSPVGPGPDRLSVPSSPGPGGASLEGPFREIGSSIGLRRSYLSRSGCGGQQSLGWDRGWSPTAVGDRNGANRGS